MRLPPESGAMKYSLERPRRVGHGPPPTVPTDAAGPPAAGADVMTGATGRAERTLITMASSEALNSLQPVNVFPLHIAALRERADDIIPLARRVLRRGTDGSARRAFSLSAATQARLTAYAWRGNIRELENVMQRAMILAPGSVIEPEHLCLPGDVPPPPGAAGRTPCRRTPSQVFRVTATTDRT